MKNPYIADSDAFKQWEIENKIYEEGQKSIKDMKEFVSEKILFVRDVTQRIQKRKGLYIPIGEKYYDICIIMDYKTQHSDIIYLQIEAGDFENWKKLREKSIKKEVIPLVEKDIKEYLDNAIEHWRGERDNMKNSKEDRFMAIHYIDAFQSVRTSLFGVLLNKKQRGIT